VELLIWVALGIVWALPLKAIFKGVGQADPTRRLATETDRSASRACRGYAMRAPRAA
jgi:hypothetical protein